MNYDPNLVGLDVFFLKIDDFRSDSNRFSEKNDVPEGIKHVGSIINDLSDSINDIQNILRDQKKVKFGVIYPINCVDNIKYYLLNQPFTTAIILHVLLA